jgi:beta-lactamase regulating signal transducer with metallopeptidase domain
MISQFLSENTWLGVVMPVMLDAAIKGAMLVLVAAIAAYLLRNRSAASRHAVWTAAVVGHLAIPVLAITLPEWRLPILPAATWMTSAPAERTVVSETPTASSEVLPRNDATPSAGRSNAANDNASLQSTVDQPSSVAGNIPSPGPLTILAAIWLAGAFLILLRLAAGTWRVGQLARDGARVEDGVWLSLTQKLANRLGVTRPLTLLRGENLAVPVTWGIVYPAVLLPQDADTWPEERRRFVLVHEMAHVKRFDALTQLLAQFSLALFWFDPLVWLASHRMRVEREHACDDYVLRDGTTPSLYAGELLEMVQSIGTRRHDRAAPAFAALAMARRSEFEGRMLAILDPRLDRHTLNRKGTLMTALIVALLTLPLAALRPFDSTPTTLSATESGDAPEMREGASKIAAPSTSATIAADTKSATPSSGVLITTIPASAGAAWACDDYRFTSLKSRSTHISRHDEKNDQRLQFVRSGPDGCLEAAIIGMARFSDDETRVTFLPAGGFARFREVVAGSDRSVSVSPSAEGALQYTAALDGRTVPFNAEMQAWLGRLLPSVLREAGINVPARVARLRTQGGVPAVLREIGTIRSTGAKRSHYEELLKTSPISPADGSKLVAQAGQDLANSSGDLSSVLQQLPRSTVQSALSRHALADALSQIKSSGDKANTLEALAPNADREMLIMLAQAAETLPSSGDKANYLTTTASEYLNSGDASLRNAFFHAAATLVSDGDLQNVLVTAMPYGHANPAIVMQVISTTKELSSSGDIATVLRNLATQRLLARNPAATLAVIERTHTMRSSGDRSMVLTTLARQGLLTTSALKEAYTRAALALPSEGDRSSALAAAARE